MLRFSPTFASLTAGLLLLTGCGSVRPAADYSRAGARAAEAIAIDSVLINLSTKEPRSQDEVASRLIGGLTTEEAVEVALLNNRELEAAFYEIGISRADVVQTGLLSNPSLGAALRFPKDDGEAVLEARLAWNLIELWHRPARERVEEQRLERTVLEVAHRAALLAADTRAAYVTAVAATDARLVEEENLASTGEFLEVTLARLDAGAATEAEANAARAEHLEQEVRLRSAGLREFERKLRLGTLLGLDARPDELVLTTPITPTSTAMLDVEALIAFAGSNRLDLRAATENVRAMESGVSLEKRMFLRELRGGVELESRGEERELGPALDMEIPLFDRNGAQITRAELRHQQAETSLDALTVAISEQVRSAHARLVSTSESARAYRDSISPLRESSLELAREAFRAGKTGFLSVLEAQKRLLAARRDVIVWAETAALTAIELEAACGRPLQEFLEETESP